MITEEDLQRLERLHDGRRLSDAERSALRRLLDAKREAPSKRWVGGAS